jgi:hypothetical protein
LTTKVGKEAFSSTRGVRTMASQSFAPFSVIPNVKCPDMSDSRRKEDREDSLQNLLRRPKHK